jgi:hypothetical protein
VGGPDSCRYPLMRSPHRFSANRMAFEGACAQISIVTSIWCGEGSARRWRRVTSRSTNNVAHCVLH